MDPRSAIPQRFVDELYVLLIELTRDTKNYQSLAALTHQVEHDYAGRFAHELIQNADDASEDEGAIKLLTDGEVLYVANTGKPFDHEDFKSICGLALSQKSIQDNIGNKGIGFRSVLEVTTSPSIYSRAGDNSERPGFCFNLTDDTRRVIKEVLLAHRDGHPVEAVLNPVLGDHKRVFSDGDPNAEKLRAVLKASPELIDEASRRIQAYQFPRPAHAPDDNVRKLWSEGYNNVFALPLNKQGAVKKANDIIGALRPKILLFLRHLTRLEVDLGPENRWSATRSKRRQPRDRRIESATITATGVGQTVRNFWLWQKTTSGQELRRALEELPEAWLKLKRARITLALEQDAHPSKAYLCVGLPTNDPTGSDLWIDAPFFPDISRKGIVIEKKLNKLLLDVAADETPRFLKALVKGSKRYRESFAALRALSFRPGDFRLEHLLKGEPRREQIRQIRMVRPHHRTERRRWLKLADLRLMPSGDLEVLTAKRLAPHMAIADPRFHQDLDNFGALALSWGAPGRPDNEEWPGLAAGVAKALSQEPPDRRGRLFRGLYQDLGHLLGRRSLPDFSGHKLVLDHTGTLRSVGGERPATFEKPQATQGGSSGVDLIDKLPKALARKIVFLHPAATEASREKGPAQDFVRRAKLVHRFETQNIVNHALVPAYRARRTSDEDRTQILAWAFELERTMQRTAGSERVRWGSLEVPTEIGWQKAEGTYTNRGWLEPEGALIRQALGAKDSRGQPRAFLEPPHQILPRLGGTDQFDAWARFLHDVLGGAKCPRVIPLSGAKHRQSVQSWNYALRPRGGGDKLQRPDKITATTWEAFLEGLERADVGGTIQASKRFTLSPLQTLDGLQQLDAQRASPYLRLLVRGQETWRSALYLRAQRADYPRERSYGGAVPSLLRAQLRTRRWLPTRLAGQSESYLAAPDEVVLVSTAREWRRGDLVQAAELLPHVDPHVTNEPAVEDVAKRLGMAIWGQMSLRQSMDWLSWLGNRETQVSDEHRTAQRSLWLKLLHHAGRLEEAKPPSRPSWKRVLADVPNQHGATAEVWWTPSPPSDDGGDGILYAPDQAQRKNQVANQVPLAVADPSALSLLQQHFGEDAVHSIGALQLVPRNGDEVLAEDAVLLRDVAPWLIDAILATTAFGRGQPMSLDGRRYLDYVERMLGLRVCHVDELELELRGKDSEPIRSPAFVWADNNLLLVDRNRGDQLAELAEALGSYLGLQDLAAHVSHALRRLVPCGLGNPPGPGRVAEELLANVLDEARLKEIQASWRRGVVWLADRVLPALAHPLGADMRPQLRDTIRRSFDPSAPPTSVIQAWLEVSQASFFPEELRELVTLALESTDSVDLARRAWELLEISMAQWNEYIEQLELDVAPVKNPHALEQTGRLRDQLYPFAILAIRRHLSATHAPEKFLDHVERLEDETPVGADVVSSWSPTLSALTAPFIELVADSESVPGWCRALQPADGETEEEYLARLREEYGEPDPAQDELDTAANVKAARATIKAFQLIALARWRALGHKDTPPKALLPDSERFHRDPAHHQALLSRLHFGPMDDAQVFEWSRHWWTANGLDASIEPLEADSLDSLKRAWNVSDEDLDAASDDSKRHEAAKRKERSKVKVLGEGYELPEAGLFDGLREVLNSKLAPDFGASLDPSSTAKTKAPKGTGKTSSTSANTRTSSGVSRRDELVGAAGEFMVYKAIQQMTRGRVGAGAWKSENRHHFLDDGQEGRDELGFDFKFQHGGITYEVEVKSTKDRRPTQVHLGPTQVVTAQRRARRQAKTVRWQIWLVSNVLVDPVFTVLGNPYLPALKGTVTEVAQGSLLRFKLPS